jgi:hypothetical protein
LECRSFTEMVLRDKEVRLIQLIRELEYGELRIVVQDKLPIRVE